MHSPPAWRGGWQGRRREAAGGRRQPEGALVGGRHSRIDLQICACNKLGAGPAWTLRLTSGAELPLAGENPG